MAEIRVFDDHHQLAREAAQCIVRAAHIALEQRGRFTIALSGGSSPRAVFDCLASDPVWRTMPWDRTLIYWSDERAVSPDDPDSNYLTASNTLLRHVPIPKDNIRRIQGELGAEEAARQLIKDMKIDFVDEKPPVFDIIMLGIGLDGHVASLFPGTRALHTSDWASSAPAPAFEPQVERISMTMPVINAARQVMFIAAGSGKQEIIARALSGKPEDANLPAAKASGDRAVWFLDKTAAPA